MSVSEGDYVWAKLTGFPLWPAKVLAVHGSSDEHHVEFLGRKRSVADAKVSPVIPETFEKNVKAGKKAKGVSFMKSVAELRQQLPVDFLAQTGLNKKSLAQIKSMEMHVPRRKPTAVAVPLPSKNCHKPCVTNSCSGNGSRYSPVKMSHLDDLAASGSSSNGSSNSSSSRRNKSVGFASDSNVQCVPIAIPVSRSAQKVVATNFKQHTSTSQLSSSESRKRPASSLDRAPAVKKSKSAPADSTSKAAASVTVRPRHKYGFIGLGIMGTGMAGNLLKHNHDVVVWNRSGVRNEELLSLGAQVAHSPADVVQRADITFSCVSTPEAAREVVERRDGVLQAMQVGKSYVDMTTVDATTASVISDLIRSKGGKYLEAPVSGSKKPAHDGQLVILTAGDEDLYNRAIPAFQAMGKIHYYLGRVGNASKMKLVVNMMMGSMITSLCEGMALAKEAGLAQKMLYDILLQGALNSKLVQAKGSAILNEEFPPSFPLKHQQKDLRLALALGDEVNQPLPMAASANETFKRAKQLGWGDYDMSSVYLAHAKAEDSS